MNISRIHKMVKDGDLSIQALRYLINCRVECEHLDFKEEFDCLSEYSAISIAKDIVGMKNIGGGYIVFGVTDKTWEPIGLSSSLNLDTKEIRDLVRKYTGLEIETFIVEHCININGDKKLFSMICVRASAKMSKLKNPSICKVSYLPKESFGIRKGNIYIRDGDQTVICTDLDDLYKKLDELIDSYQEAENFESTNMPSPFAIETGLYRLLPKEYDSFVGRKELIQKIKNSIERDPRIWIINIYGPGGVGKSAIATRIAYDCLQNREFEAILQLSAKDRELEVGQGIKSLRPSLVSIEDFVNKLLCLFSYEECCEEDLEKRKKQVIELLNAFKTLIILDNMETVNDGRIMDFIRELPPETKAKVLLTSRQRNSGWEFPIQVPELSIIEIKEFLKIRSNELNLDFPYDDEKIIQKINDISGGLPLAIQWILGEFSITLKLNEILRRVLSSDSALLEFSFRNSWNVLDIDAKQALAVMSIFNENPTLQLWRTVLNWTIDRMERAIGKLIETTFITKRTDQKTGDEVYFALPITLSFARIELDKVGEWGIDTRKRYESYTQRILLAFEQESQSENLFSRFEAVTDNQKKAILLARMAEGQMLSLGYNEADEYYKQALDIDPLSIYTLVSYGKLKADLYEYNTAIELMKRAIPNINKNTAFFVYFNLANVFGKMKDRASQIKYLKKSMNYKNNTSLYLYTMAQHSLGVALGKIGRHLEAIKHFDEIIERELSKAYGPSDSLVIAARTKKISLDRLDPGSSKAFLDRIIDQCTKFQNIDHIVDELIQIRDYE